MIVFRFLVCHCNESPHNIFPPNNLGVSAVILILEWNTMCHVVDNSPWSSHFIVIGLVVLNLVANISCLFRTRQNTTMSKEMREGSTTTATFFDVFRNIFIMMSKFPISFISDFFLTCHPIIVINDELLLLFWLKGCVCMCIYVLYCYTPDKCMIFNVIHLWNFAWNQWNNNKW